MASWSAISPLRGKPLTISHQLCSRSQPPSARLRLLQRSLHLEGGNCNQYHSLCDPCRNNIQMEPLLHRATGGGFVCLAATKNSTPLGGRRMVFEPVRDGMKWSSRRVVEPRTMGEPERRFH